MKNNYADTTYGSRSPLHRPLLEGALLPSYAFPSLSYWVTKDAKYWANQTFRLTCMPILIFS